MNLFVKYSSSHTSLFKYIQGYAIVAVFNSVATATVCITIAPVMNPSSSITSTVVDSHWHCFSFGTTHHYIIWKYFFVEPCHLLSVDLYLQSSSDVLTLELVEITLPVFDAAITSFRIPITSPHAHFSSIGCRRRSRNS